jgi:DNA-binding protein HU-beta
MNKGGYVNIIANMVPAELGITKEEITLIIDEAHEVIKRALKNNDVVKIAGFGTFFSKEKMERNHINPYSGEKIRSPKKKLVKFRASKKFNIES